MNEKNTRRIKYVVLYFFNLIWAWLLLTALYLESEVIYVTKIYVSLKYFAQTSHPGYSLFIYLSKCCLKRSPIGLVLIFT